MDGGWWGMLICGIVELDHGNESFGVGRDAALKLHVSPPCRCSSGLDKECLCHLVVGSEL
jgi:hypothetical protein